MGYIEAICVSKKKGIVKKNVKTAVFKQGWGIESDAHAGNWHRQVSLLPGESIDRMKDMIPELANGAFAENIVTRGVDFSDIGIGDRINLGTGIVLEVTQIGKECHAACAIKTITGDCIMPREGIFARVITGGTLHVGCDAGVNYSVSKKTIQNFYQ